MKQAKKLTEEYQNLRTRIIDALRQTAKTIKKDSFDVINLVARNVCVCVDDRAVKLVKVTDKCLMLTVENTVANNVFGLEDTQVSTKLLLETLKQLEPLNRERYKLATGYEIQNNLMPNEISVAMVLDEDEPIEFEKILKTVRRNRKALGQYELTEDQIREIINDLQHDGIIILTP